MEELIRILFKRLKLIIAVCAVAAAISVVAALLLPNIYQSSVTFIVMNPHMMDRESLFRGSGGSDPVYLFGGKYEMERFISLSQSRELEDYVINKYDLINHYEIEPDDPEKDYWVRETLRDNMKITKTKSNMLIAQVLDEDPQLAANMANDIVAKLDEMHKKLITEKKIGMTKLYNEKVSERKDQLQGLLDSLQSVVSINPDDTVTANLLTLMVEDAANKYNKMATISDEHTSALSQEYSTIYLVEKAMPAVKKSKPVRWLIVVTSCLVALVSMIFIVVFIEKYKEFNLSPA